MSAEGACRDDASLSSDATDRIPTQVENEIIKICERYGESGETLIKHGLVSNDCRNMITYFLKKANEHDKDFSFIIQQQMATLLEIFQKIKNTLSDKLIASQKQFHPEDFGFDKLKTELDQIENNLLDSKNSVMEFRENILKVLKMFRDCSLLKNQHLTITELKVIKSVYGSLKSAILHNQNGQLFRSVQCYTDAVQMKHLVEKYDCYQSIIDQMEKIKDSIDMNLRSHLRMMISEFNLTKYKDFFTHYVQLRSISFLEGEINNIIQREILSLFQFLQMNENDSCNSSQEIEEETDVFVQTLASLQHSSFIKSKMTSYSKNIMVINRSEDLKQRVSQIVQFYTKCIFFVASHVYLVRNSQNGEPLDLSPSSDQYLESLFTIEEPKNYCLTATILNTSQIISHFISSISIILKTWSLLTVMSFLREMNIDLSQAISDCGSFGNVYFQPILTAFEKISMNYLLRTKSVSLEELRLYLENESWNVIPCDTSTISCFVTKDVIEDVESNNPLMSNSCLNVLKIFVKILPFTKITRICKQTLSTIFLIFDYYIYLIYQNFGLGSLESEENEYLSSNYKACWPMKQLLMRVEHDSGGPSKFSKSIHCETDCSNTKPEMSYVLKCVSVYYSIRMIHDKLSSLAIVIKDNYQVDLDEDLNSYLVSQIDNLSVIVKNMESLLAQSCIISFFNPGSIKQEMSLIQWSCEDFIYENNSYVNTLTPYLLGMNVISDGNQSELQTNLQSVYQETIENIWQAFLCTICHTFVEGFSFAKNCSQEGRALMQLDFQQFLTNCQKYSGKQRLGSRILFIPFDVIFRVSPNDRERVEGYIKAFYLSHEDLIKFCNSKEKYTKNQLTRLWNLMKNESNNSNNDVDNKNSKKFKKMFSRMLKN